MKYKLFFYLLLFLPILSCKKEETTTPPPVQTYPYDYCVTVYDYETHLPIPNVRVDWLRSPLFNDSRTTDSLGKVCYSVNQYDQFLLSDFSIAGYFSFHVENALPHTVYLQKYAWTTVHVRNDAPANVTDSLFVNIPYGYPGAMQYHFFGAGFDTTFISLADPRGTSVTTMQNGVFDTIPFHVVTGDTTAVLVAY